MLSSEHSVRRASPDGYAAACKACASIGKKVSYTKHKERALATIKAWKLANHAKVRGYGRAYDRAHPEKKRAQKRKYEARRVAERAVVRAAERAIRVERAAAEKAARRAEREALRAKNAELRAEKLRAKGRRHTAARRASKRQAMPAWVDREAIAAVYAGAIKWGWQVDHVVPLRHKLVSGLHVPANLQALHAEENFRKSNLHWPDMP